MIAEQVLKIERFKEAHVWHVLPVGKLVLVANEAPNGRVMRYGTLYLDGWVDKAVRDRAIDLAKALIRQELQADWPFDVRFTEDVEASSR